MCVNPLPSTSPACPAGATAVPPRVAAAICGIIAFHLRKRPTIVDIANACGVTHATVSRVLNGKLNVRPELREQILRTAEDIGYAPNLAARSLNGSSDHIIGVFASRYTDFTKGISEFLLEGLVEVLQPLGYEVFFRLLRAKAGNEAAVRTLPFWRFDGAILLQAPDPEIVAALRRRRVPYIGVNEVVEGAAGNVLSNDSGGVELALDHLHELGHRTIAYANAGHYYLPHYSIEERHASILSGTRVRKMTLTEGHDQPFTWEDAAGFLRKAKSAGATAIVTYDHQEAMLLLGAAYTEHLRIPDEMSLICFNDVFPLEFLPPPLTAVRVPGQQMGEVGAKLLLKALSAKTRQEPAEAKVVRVDEMLIVRGSTAPPQRAP